MHTSYPAYHDDDQEEQRRWTWLAEELSVALKAAESEFVPLDAASLIAEAKRRKHAAEMETFHHDSKPGCQM